MQNKISAIIDIQCRSEREFGFDRIALRIAKFPEVMDVSVISGRADLTVKVEANDINKISRFVTEVLAPMEGVESTSTHFLLKEYKRDGEILVEEPKPSRLPISA